MNELRMIQLLTAGAKRSPDQLNALNTSDAEIVRIGGQLLAVSVDEFSAEDCLPTSSPSQLGWNLVAGVMSDILAVGATPKFLLQSVAASREMDEAFLTSLASGVNEALLECGAFLIGGDSGNGQQWRYSGVGIGTFDNVTPLSRIVKPDSGVICVSGPLGDGNAAAVTGTLPLRFEFRKIQSRSLAKFAAACIDTSDGFAAAMECMSQINPRLRIEIDLESVPLAESATITANTMKVSPLTMLLGSAGEYELVGFVGGVGDEELRAAGLHIIGRFDCNSPSGVFYRRANGKLVRQPVLPDPREVGDMHTYATMIAKIGTQIFVDDDERRRG